MGVSHTKHNAGSDLMMRFKIPNLGVVGVRIASAHFAAMRRLKILLRLGFKEKTNFYRPPLQGSYAEGRRKELSFSIAFVPCPKLCYV